MVLAELPATSLRFCKPFIYRGVAQPGRAPGSGPGGRRFKSSLPDQFLQSLTRDFWFSVYSGVDDFEAVRASEINKLILCQAQKL